MNLDEGDIANLELIFKRPIFQAYIQRRPDFNPNMQDEYFGTIAMFKLTYGLEIEEELRHDPNIQNDRSQTIEIMCYDKKVQPQEWMMCNPFIKDYTGNAAIHYRINTLRQITPKFYI
ncbi:Hypothetical_protein [Hexamita inflata]|uniref:Hypothetical_protein n=1 Tax=Hexamita inflata TaxID=28002 RepID=A0AA86Q2Q3_9EUKA|nr:Hypothetical protein HINF_LOCUS36113 [Hexamita inflata]